MTDDDKQKQIDSLRVVEENLRRELNGMYQRRRDTALHIQKICAGRDTLILVSCFMLTIILTSAIILMYMYSASTWFGAACTTILLVLIATVANIIKESYWNNT